MTSHSYSTLIKHLKYCLINNKLTFPGTSYPENALTNLCFPFSLSILSKLSPILERSEEIKDAIEKSVGINCNFFSVALAKHEHYVTILICG